MSLMKVAIVLVIAVAFLADAALSSPTAIMAKVGHDSKACETCKHIVAQIQSNIPEIKQLSDAACAAFFGRSTNNYQNCIDWAALYIEGLQELTKEDLCKIFSFCPRNKSSPQVDFNGSF